MFKLYRTNLPFIVALAVISFFLTGCTSQPSGKVRPIDAADHIKGDLRASAQLIVYSDFQCPFCAGYADTIKRVEQEFGDKVVIAFRHFPLAGHAEALPAALASECAAEQGQFWAMHDKLFADNVASHLGAEQYKKDAADLGLDQNKFNECFSNGKYLSAIKEQMAEAKSLGISGTPTSFINGNIYPGAYPFEDFADSSGKLEKGLKSLIEDLLK